MVENNNAESANPFQSGLDKNQANYTPLTPITFLDRTSSVFPDHPSIIHGAVCYTWRETAARCRKLASALKKIGIASGDTVAVMAPNTPAIYESHFGVPMCGAVLSTLNVRLDASTIAYILEHGEAKVLLTDIEFSSTIKAALAQLKNPPMVIDIEDADADGEVLGDTDYESFLNSGEPDSTWPGPQDEWQAISLNYTSGTTGNPKGVVYHHRGAYLNAVSNALVWDMGHHPVYLWTLPMFHCNGWCFPWTLAALAGTSICQRKVNAKNIFNAINEHKVDHFCGAPIVMNFLINATKEESKPLPHKVKVMTAAAPPPAAVLDQMESLGFHLTHAYGLTETYGPAVVCAWKEEWDELSRLERAQKKSRQGVRYHALDDLTVMDPEKMQPVPADGESIGEVMFRGNIVMKGYLKNQQATQDAFGQGWFHSGDLGVMHPDRYIQLKDRSKDIIISGGENISSIEVEDTLYRHPAVLEAAVVARADDKWGERPCAFVDLKDSALSTTKEEIIAFCREHLAGFKIPDTIVFQTLPKTSTGKIQKFKLRQIAEQLSTEQTDSEK